MKRMLYTVGVILTIPILMILFLYILSLKYIGKPVLFTQERAGLHGKPFNIYKFRTMSDERDSDGELLPSYERVTNYGKILRKTSLDELPQIINLLKGDISLVGPRPLHVEYNEYYNEHQKKRLTVKPGITGYAQVNGRNNISWEEKFDLDVYYVENKSLWLDIKILILTILKVVKSEDINPIDQKETPRFRG